VQDQSWEQRLQSVQLILKESRTKAASFSQTHPKHERKMKNTKKKHVLSFILIFLNHNSDLI
jgi:hypothetical protein